jgi:hypothetical protein
MILEKKRPSTQKISVYHRFNRNGVCYEFDPKQCRIGLARYRFRTLAATFTTTMFTANRVATNISSAQRSLYMLLAVL